MLTRVSSSRLILQVVMTLILVAVMLTSLLVLVFSPSYAASASNLPTIQSLLQAYYQRENLPLPVAPLKIQELEINLP